MLRGRYKLVYAAPERLVSDAFVDALARCNVQLVAVDEAHCIAAVGPRLPAGLPAHRRAAPDRLRPPRVLACTATATPEVRAEIRQQLRLGDDCHEVLRGFARPNLHLAARNVDGVSEARGEVFAALAPRPGRAARAPRRRHRVRGHAQPDRAWAETLARQGLERGRVPRRDGVGRSAATSPRASRRVRSTWSWRRTPSAWASTAPTSARCSTCSRPRRSRRTTRRWGARAATGRRRGACSSARARTSRSAGAWSPRAATAPGPGRARRARLGALPRAAPLPRRAHCRHDFILRYFGDEQSCWAGAATATSASALDDRDGRGRRRRRRATEAAKIVRMALSAVARARQRAGMHGDRRDAPRRRQRADAPLRLHGAVDVRPAARAFVGVGDGPAAGAARGGAHRSHGRPSTPCRCSRAWAAR